MKTRKLLIVPVMWITLSVLVVSLIISVIEILSVLRSLTGNADLSIPLLQYLLILSVILFMFILLVGVIGLFFDDSRRSSILVLILCLVFSLAHGYALRKGYTVMAQRIIERLSQNSAPLVDAVRRYKEERGELPETILEVMPSYIDEMPETDFDVSPYFIYMAGEQAQVTYEQPWALYVELPAMFDEIMRCAYLPETEFKWECRLTDEPLPQNSFVK